MNEEVVEVKAKPFLKWAGGKTQMIGDITPFVPSTYNKYIEPFIGAGALFFHLQPNEAIISDTNSELILTYNVIKDSPEDLIDCLGGFKNSESDFYKVRAWNLNRKSDIERAARLIYLNKTCFNGLYRVNRKGEFNTPYGKRKNPKICDAETLRSVSQALQNVTILNFDFEKTLNEFVEPGDLVFLDPPYVPVGEYADFKRYTKDFFTLDDHRRLKKQFDRIVEIGAHPILTNSDAEFVLDLFSEYKIEIVNTRRSISSNPKSRKGKDIIVIG